MKNFETIKVPKTPSVPFHIIIKPSYFLETDQYPVGTSITSGKRLSLSEPVILLEEGVGGGGKWCRIVIRNSENDFKINGFVLQDTIGRVRDAKPSIIPNPLKDFLPDRNAVEIDWRAKQTNVVFEDNRKGVYSVLYDTGVEALDNNLEKLMTDSLYTSLQLILKDQGKQHNIEYVRELQDKYYLFAQAEAIDFSLRNCSSMRVLVSVPKRYIHSLEIVSSSEDSVTESDLANDFLVQPNLLPSFDSINKIPVISAPQPDRYTDIVFNNYEEFENFMDDISYTVPLGGLPFGALDKAEVIFRSREWIITPDYIPTLAKDAAGITNIKQETDLLILKNLSVELIEEVVGGENLLNLRRDTEKFSQTLDEFSNNVLSASKDVIVETSAFLLKESFNVQNEIGSGFAIAGSGFAIGATTLASPLAAPVARIAGGVTKRFGEIIGDLNNYPFFTDGIFWKGKLTLKIDKIDYKIALVTFETPSGKKLPLNLGVIAYLENEDIKNKRLVNYILERHNSKIGFTTTLKALVGFGIADNILNIGFQAGANLVSSVITGQSAEPVGPAADLKRFLTKYHKFPTIENIEPRPLNISACVKNLYQVTKSLKDRKLPATIERFKRIRNLDIKNQTAREGNPLLQAFDKNRIRNRNFRILLGVDKPPSNMGTLDRLNRYYLPALKELNLTAVLLEVLKCNTATLDPATFLELLRRYNVAKEALEQFVAATLCNPFLNSALNKLNSFQLPTLQTYNPNKVLVEELTKLVAKIIEKILILGVRQLLTGSIEACVRDNNKSSPSAGDDQAAQDLADSLTESPNDANINDVIDDIFDIDPDGTLTPDELEDARAAIKDKLAKFLEDLNCLLTAKELCDLLRGRTPEGEVFEIIKSVIRNKFPELSRRFSTNSDILYLFSSIGRNIDLSICPDIDNADANRIPTSCACDDGTIRNARDEILNNKNIDKDLIDDLLKDIREKEIKNVEDILKFLDSDNPFDFSNVPSVLCETAPDGTIITPEVSLALPIESFKSLLNVLFEDTYNTFDKEAARWSTTAYSVQSDIPNIIGLDKETGKITANVGGTEIKVPNSSSYDKNTKTRTERQPSKTILPGYLFNDIIKNNGYKFDETNKFIFKVPLIDGNKQEKLDINVIDDALRKNAARAENVLKEFLADFLTAYSVYAGLRGVGLFSEGIAAIANSRVTDTGILNTINEINNNLIFLDNFLRTNPGQNDASIIETLPSNNDSLAAFYEANGIPLYPKIMEFLKSKQVDFANLLRDMQTILATSTYTLPKPNETVTDYFSDRLEDAIREYESVKKTYSVVSQTALNYPSYSLTFTDNVKKNVETKKSLYYVYNLNIGKNSSSSSYINIEDYVDYENSEMEKFVINELGFSNTVEKDLPLNKKDVFASYIRKYNSNIPLNLNLNEIYDFITTNSYESTIRNIAGSYFLTSSIVQAEQISSSQDPIDEEITVKRIIPEVTKPISDYLQLVLENSPTPQQKECGIRPHYLDIDNLKNEAIDAKKGSLCIEEAVNEKVRNNLPVNSSELQTLETNDTQNILLTASFRLALRVYLHDIVLRGIGVFGYYDPQVFRDDSLFINFLSANVESEMRGIDDTFFNLMVDFFVKQYRLKNPDVEQDFTKNPIRRQVLKNVIRDELRKNVLPKLSKRIHDDTNRKLLFDNVKINNSDEKIEFKLKFLSTSTDINEYFDNSKIVLEEKSNKVQINIEKDGVNYSFIVFEGTLGEFNETKKEFQLLFSYLFPVKKHLCVLYITNVLCTSTRKQILDVFRGTKKGLRRLCKQIITNGQPLVANPNNPQDVINNDTEDDLLWFILEALITTPLKIAKGFIETADANVALSSTVYKIGKTLDPTFSSWIIPSIGVPLSLLGFIPIIGTPFVPFLINQFNGAYYGLGLWYEDNNSNPKDSFEAKKRKYLEDLINNAEAAQQAADCELQKNHEDIVRLDENGLYKKEENK